MYHFRLATAAPTLLLGVACAAQARTADVVAAGNAASIEQASALSVEEITVTARRVRENLQDTPIAVTALNPAALENRSIQDTLDLQRYVPNLSSTTGYSGGSYANYFIRGIGQGLQNTGVDPGVGLYIDGVYIGRPNGADISTLDLDRVEVLRGPQGTLFGKNTLGGAINVFTRQPTNDDSAEIKLNVGSRNWYEARGWVNAAIVPDKLLARISMDAKTQDGYGIARDTGHRFGDVRTESFRSHLLYEATPDLTFDLIGDYRHIGGTGNMVKLNGVGQLGYIPAGYDQYSLPGTGYQTYSGYDAGNSFDGGGASLNATWRLAPNFDVKSITAYRRFKHRSANDFDGGPGSLIDERIDTKQHQFSEELQHTGKAFDDRLTYLVGLYFYREVAQQAIPLFQFSPTALNEVSDLKVRNYSAFSQATYKILDWLSATAGLRYTFEQKIGLSQSYFFTTYDAFYDLSIDQTINPPAALRGHYTLAPTAFDRKWYSTTPKFSLEAKVTDDTLAYFSYSEGFKSGGFNNYAATADYRTYNPEELATYEVGVKTELFDHRMRLNLAAFYSDYTDAQLAVLANTPEGLVIATQNAGKSRIYGAEGEVTLRVTPLFTVDGSFGYLKNKYLSLTQGAIAAQVDYGDSLIQAPVWTANAGVQYELPMADGGSLTYRADVSYKDKFYFFAANEPLDVQRPLTLVNVRLTYDSGSQWTAAVFANNLLNKYYYSLREDIRYVYDVALDWPAPPRVVGMELNYKF